MTTTKNNPVALATWATDLLLLLEREDVSSAELEAMRPPTAVEAAISNQRPDIFQARESLRHSLERVAIATTKHELDEASIQWFLNLELPRTVCRFNALHALLAATE